MQFASVTDSGFRFALAHFPVDSLPAVIMLEKFWEGVKWCRRAGFRHWSYNITVLLVIYVTCILLITHHYKNHEFMISPINIIYTNLPSNFFLISIEHSSS